MWDVLLYICCFYWLMNKAALVYIRAEYSQAGKDIEREQAESGSHNVAAIERHARTLPSRPQPHGNTQIDRNWLIEDVRAC